MPSPHRPAATCRDDLANGTTGERASVLLIAGEASGDWAGSLVARVLHGRRPELMLQGIGGRQLAGAGVTILADSTSWAAIGLWESLARAPRVWPALRLVKRLLTSSPPSLLVLIDSGAINYRIARMARTRGVPTLYYFPPRSWARRGGRSDLPELVDAIATPFPWSADLLSGGRARVVWVGHPVMEAAQPQIPLEEAWARYGLDPRRPVVALAPGSRDQEMHYVLPVVAGAAARLTARVPGVQFVVPLAPSVGSARVASTLGRAGVQARLLSGMDYDALQLARAAVVCSGTVTLGFCCLRTPMVIVYRASRATTLQYRLFQGLIGGERQAGLPNILAGREIVPELLGSACQPDRIAETVAELLGDGAGRARMQHDLGEAAQALGAPGASTRTAELALELLTEARDARARRR